MEPVSHPAMAKISGIGENPIMKKLGIVVGLVVGMFFAGSSEVLAHDPIILTPEQMTPEDGPFLPDGTISFALYGSIKGGDDRRAFSVAFQEGDRLFISFLIPDLPPENELSENELPYLELVDPQGNSVILRPDQRTPFAEPFSGTNYIRLLDWLDEAQSGTYSIIVSGSSVARFTVSVGEKEVFGTPVERVPNRSVGVAGVMDWYATPPVTLEATTTVVTPTTSSRPSDASPDTDGTSEDDSSSALTSNGPLVLIVVVLILGVLIVLAVRRRQEKQT